MNSSPAGWCLVKLHELGAWGSGGTPSKGNAAYYQGNVPWAVIGDLNDDLLIETANKISAAGLANSSAKLIPAGALLIAMYGSIGKLAIAGIECSTNQAIAFCIVDNEIIDTKYIFYALKWARSELVKLGQGASQQNISQTILKSFEVPLAPKTEQTRIAAKLEELLAQVDTLKSRIDSIPTLLKHFRQSVLASAISGRLTEEWRKKDAEFSVTTIGKICTVSTGKTPKRSQAEYWKGGDIPWLTSALTSSKFCSESEQFVTKLALKECALKLYQPGTLLMAMYGEGKTRGQVTELKIAATCNQACAAISVNEMLANKDFVKIRLLENYEAVRKQAVGGAQPNLNLEKVREITICLPSMEEQAEIVHRVEQLFAFADQLEVRIKATQTRINRLTQSILAKAYRGELVSQDPNDEPASVLLDRIKVQRAAAPNAKRSRRSAMAG